MARYFRFVCADCGEPAVNDEKRKRYVHLSETRGVRSMHELVKAKAIEVTRSGPRTQPFDETRGETRDE